MKVQLTTQISGTRNGEDWPAPGSIVDLPDDESKQLLFHGLAREPKKIETADASSFGIETATADASIAKGDPNVHVNAASTEPPKPAPKPAAKTVPTKRTTAAKSGRKPAAKAPVKPAAVAATGETDASEKPAE